MAKPLLKLGVLVSGSGRTLQNFIDLGEAGELPAKVVTVIGSRPGLVGIERGVKAGIPSHVVHRKQFASVAAFSQAVFDLLDLADVDLVCLAGWLCLLDVPERYAGRILNIHPALLPSFGGHGMWGHHVHEAVLSAGCKVSGCTVHFVDATYDTGPIVIQRCCPVLEGDDADTLAARVFEEEKIAYPEAIRLYAEGKLKIEGRRVRVG